MPTPTTNNTIALDTPSALPVKAYLVQKYKSPIEAGEEDAALALQRIGRYLAGR